MKNKSKDSLRNAESALPSNRIQSFFDCLKSRLNTIFQCGLVFLFFSIPLILISFLTNIAVYEVNLHFENNELTAEAAALEIISLTNTSNLFRILAFLVIGVAISGLMRVFKNIVFQEPVFFFHDFSKGVKQNIKGVSLVMFLIGAYNFLFFLVVRSSYLNDDTFIASLIIAILIAVYIVLLILSIFFLFQTNIYELSVSARLKNSVILFSKSIPKTLLAIFVLIAPWTLILINNGVFHVIILLVLFLIIAPLELLGLTEYMHYIFDRYINKDNFIEIYRKGLENARD